MKVYDDAGRCVREVQSPTYKQLTPLWQKYVILYFLGY